MSLYIGNKKYAPIIRQGVNNQDKTITENGVYTADEGYTGLGEVTVDVPQGEATRFGVNFDDLLGVINSDGKLEKSTQPISLNFEGVRDIGRNACTRMFYESSGVTSASFPSLTTISGDNACTRMFYTCKNLTSVSFPSLTTTSGGSACSSMFSYCKNLTSASFPSLTTISGDNACSYMFNGCTNLTSVSFPSLTTISKTYACQEMFQGCIGLSSVDLSSLTTISGGMGCVAMFHGCKSLTSISFPKLNTNSFGTLYKNQFQNMVVGVTGCTLHFPSNLQSTISTLTGYPNFDGTNTVLAFDLPATS